MITSLHTLLNDAETYCNLQRRTLSKGFAIPCVRSPFIRTTFAPNEERLEPSLKVGAECSLSGQSCDGFNMQKRDYKVIAMVDDIDSVVVKQVSGELPSATFSLTRTDCHLLNIQYEPMLLLYPKTLSWQVKPSENDEEKKNKSQKFSANDLSTYPLSYTDRCSIKQIAIKLEGFKVVEGDKIITPTQPLPTQSFDDFIATINIFTEIHIPTASSNWVGLSKYQNIPFRVLEKHPSVILELNFEKTVDGISKGVNPESLKGLSFDDVFVIRYSDIIKNKTEERKYVHGFSSVQMWDRMFINPPTIKNPFRYETDEDSETTIHSTWF